MVGEDVVHPTHSAQYIYNTNGLQLYNEQGGPTRTNHRSGLTKRATINQLSIYTIIL